MKITPSYILYDKIGCLDQYIASAPAWALGSATQSHTDYIYINMGA